MHHDATVCNLLKGTLPFNSKACANAPGLILMPGVFLSQGAFEGEKGTLLFDLCISIYCNFSDQ